MSVMGDSEYRRVMSDLELVTADDYMQNDATLALPFAYASYTVLLCTRVQYTKSYQLLAVNVALVIGARGKSLAGSQLVDH